MEGHNSRMVTRETSHVSTGPRNWERVIVLFASDVNFTLKRYSKSSQ